MLDLTDVLQPPPRTLSAFSQRMVTSEILTMAYEVAERIRNGEDILNLTVGDFKPAEFPIPDGLSRALRSALERGETNYPPAPGIPQARRAVAGMFERRLGLKIPVDSVVMVSGARPAIAGAYLALVDPGDAVVYGLPSWNNNHYSRLVGARMVELPTTPENFFFPEPSQIEPHLKTARLICLNTPQNPTGTVIRKDHLEAICRMVVEENHRRERAHERGCYLLFDQVYWALTFDGTEHVTPPHLVPEVARYTVFADGISKGFAATGLRVGWAVAPTDVAAKIVTAEAHLGAWAPRAEQFAAAELLSDDGAMDAYLEQMRRKVLDRLTRLRKAILHFKEAGWNVDAIAPQGAIYLSIKLDLRGKKTRSGEVLETDQDIWRHVLEEAGIALVPFQGFGLTGDSQWFRASVGVASVADCDSVQGRLQRALDALSD